MLSVVRDMLWYKSRREAGKGVVECKAGLDMCQR